MSNLPVVSRWRYLSNGRLRSCLRCEQIFISYGSENRFCVSCSKKIAEARARPFIIDQEERDRVNELLDAFDEDLVDRARRAKEHDDRERRKRRGF